MIIYWKKMMYLILNPLVLLECKVLDLVEFVQPYSSSLDFSIDFDSSCYCEMNVE